MDVWNGCKCICSLPFWMCGWQLHCHCPASLRVSYYFSPAQEMIKIQNSMYSLHSTFAFAKHKIINWITVSQGPSVNKWRGKDKAIPYSRIPFNKDRKKLPFGTYHINKCCEPQQNLKLLDEILILKNKVKAKS